MLPDGNQHSDYGLMAGLVRLPVEGHDILLFNIYLFYESDGGAKMASFNLAWVTGGKDWKEFLPIK